MALMMLNKTAAEPTSLAFFDKGWRSVEILSTTASTAELSSSTNRTKNKLLIKIALVNRGTCNQAAVGTRKKHSSTSKTKAGSVFKAALMPCIE